MGPSATNSSRREREAEYPLKPWRHRRRQPELEPEIEDDEPLDLEPLPAEMPDEEDHDEEIQLEIHED
ncbi:hypothetical protein A2U01_0087804, partial [Trifolium medium]|nr:hypothetical protein [Trifolium medium]